jgi:hypothetical protein
MIKLAILIVIGMTQSPTHTPRVPELRAVNVGAAPTSRLIDAPCRVRPLAQGSGSVAECVW